VSDAAGIEPRTFATSALAVRRSNHSARSRLQSENCLYPPSEEPEDEEKRVKGLKEKFCGRMRDSWAEESERRLELKIRKKRLGTENQSQSSCRTLEPKSKAKKEKLRLMPIFKGLSGKSKDG
jgi:hypothetical protein